MTERFVISINERYEITAHAGQPILDSMVAAGYKMRSSCRNGVCEVCQLTLMKGSIIQRYPELDLSIEEGHKPRRFLRVPRYHVVILG